MPKSNGKYKYSKLKECGGIKENYFVTYALEPSCGIPNNWTKTGQPQKREEKACNTGPFWGRTC